MINFLNTACYGFILSIILVAKSTHHELVEGNCLKKFLEAQRYKKANACLHMRRKKFCLKGLNLR